MGDTGLGMPDEDHPKTLEPALAPNEPLLSPKQVLQALWDGQSLSQAALNLGTSYRTAESDRHRLKGKFGVSNVPQLIRAALRLGC